MNKKLIDKTQKTLVEELLFKDRVISALKDYMGIENFRELMRLYRSKIETKPKGDNK